MKLFFSRGLRFLLYLGCWVIMHQSKAQCLPSKLEDYNFVQHNQCMTIQADQAGRPYLYSASKELGLQVFSHGTSSTTLVNSIPVSSLGNLQVMRLYQQDTTLYLALGNYFNNNEVSGAAVINVSDPTNPYPLGVWKYNKTGGAGDIRVEGNYIYLAAMYNGLIILDGSDPANLKQIGIINPDISFPNPVNPDRAKYNVRGLEVKDGIAYICYDAGGVRVINCKNPAAPVETGRYANALLNNRPRAYNQLVYRKPYLYVATDYCGLEILDISDTSHITQKGWWNPWHCEQSSNTWFNSPGYTNELVLDTLTQRIYTATGRAQMHILDVSDPANPDSCASWGSVSDQAGTWGIGIYGDEVFLSYIYVPLGIPFKSLRSGFSIFKKPALVGIKNELTQTHFRLQGGSGVIGYESDVPQQLYLYDLSGKMIGSIKANGSGQMICIPGVYICVPEHGPGQKVMVW